MLGTARLPIQLDIGFGDSAYPEPAWLDYPTLLDFEAPRLLCYAPETAIAEKFHAIVELEMINTRLKYDLWFLAEQLSFDATTLGTAISETFLKRNTPLPTGVPVGLSDEFSGDPRKQKQWKAFFRRGKLEAPVDLKDAVTNLRNFFHRSTTRAATRSRIPKSSNAT